MLTISFQEEDEEEDKEEDEEEEKAERKRHTPPANTCRQIFTQNKWVVNEIKVV